MTIEIERPRTAEQIAALPEDGFGVTTYEFTEADRERGYAEIKGALVEVHDGIRQVQYPMPIETVGFFAEESDVTHYIDSEGVRWALRRYRTGGWFRERV